MSMSDTREATITLLDYLALLREGLDSPELFSIASESDIADFYGDALRYIEAHGLLDADSVLYDTLKIIEERFSTAELHIGLASLATLLDSVIGYVSGARQNEHIQTLTSYLPDAFAHEYASMLLVEAGVLFAGEGDHPSPLSPESSSQNGIDVGPENGSAISALAADQDDSRDNPSPLPAGTIPAPLQVAIQFVLDELNELLAVGDDSAQNGVSRPLVENQLENLTFIAENTGFENFRQQLATERAWIDETSGASEIIPKPLLAELVHRLDGWIPSAVVSDSAMPTGAVVDSPAPLPASVLTFTDERLGMLHEELSDFDEPLSTQACVITDIDSDTETLFVTVSKYSELMERLVRACDALGLQGLKRICNFVIENVNLLPAMDPSSRPQLRPLLLRWPQMVKHYLLDPTDDSALMGLIDLMQDKLWPACFDGLDSRDLYAELSSGADNDDEADDETEGTTEVCAEDVSLAMGADINPQLLDAYLIESPDVAAQFSQVIGNLATSANPLEGVRAAQRLSHTLKGSANLVGIKGIANLAHHIEDILDILSRKGSAPSASLTALLQEAADCLEGMLDAVAGLASPPADAAAVLQRVIDVATHIGKGNFDPSLDIPLADRTAPVAEAPSIGEPAPQPGPAGATTADTFRVPTHTVDAMFRLVEEVTINLAQIRERVNRATSHSDSLNKHDRNLQLRRFDLENLVDVRSIATMQKRLHRSMRGDDVFDPLEMDQYDRLHGATHSYIEAVADARQISGTIQRELLEIDRLITRHSRLNKELQHLVSTTRMVPVSNIGSRLHRTVRQAGRATGKAAELVINDQNLLLDGDVLNKLIEPLSHILRNAVDHGMPDPGEGQEPGRITVTFAQEGNSMVIRCTDNGRGLNYARIREVAVERGLIKMEHESSREELAQLIMSPAFTTRQTATHISGRGIGLDAALMAVTELKGSIKVRNAEPHGTEFIIYLPLSLVTTNTLVVRVGTAIYAIPTSSLVRILPARRGEIIDAEDGHALRFNGEVYPLKSLSTLTDGMLAVPSGSNPILLANQGMTTTAIAVDELVNSFELVIKRLGRLAPRVPGVIGVSVLSDGQIVPVLDIAGLLTAGSERGTTFGYDAQTGFTGLAARPSAIKRHVLIVDDSLSARNSLAHLLEDSGYAVLSARDGVEAVEMLQRAKPLVVLADMEMPRMDGIELTRHIRANKDFSELPVVMITSRSQKKHRDVAQAAGVSAYLTKPFVDNELVDLVSNLVSQQ